MRAKQLQKGRLYLGLESEGTPVTSGKGPLQKLKAGVHVVPSARKQRRINSDSQLVFSFFGQSWTPAHGMMSYAFRVTFPCSLVTRLIHTYTHKAVLIALLNPIKD